MMGKFGHLYEQQYAVALFNKVRFDIEGGGGPQPQLLHRKVKPLLPPLCKTLSTDKSCYMSPNFFTHNCMEDQLFQEKKNVDEMLRFTKVKIR